MTSRLTVCPSLQYFQRGHQHTRLSLCYLGQEGARTRFLANRSAISFTAWHLVIQTQNDDLLLAHISFLFFQSPIHEFLKDPSTDTNAVTYLEQVSFLKEDGVQPLLGSGTKLLQRKLSCPCVHCQALAEQHMVPDRGNGCPPQSQHAVILDCL